MPTSNWQGVKPSRESEKKRVHYGNLLKLVCLQCGGVCGNFKFVSSSPFLFCCGIFCLFKAYAMKNAPQFGGRLLVFSCALRYLLEWFLMAISNTLRQQKLIKYNDKQHLFFPGQ